jgi:hypothetical protein
MKNVRNILLVSASLLATTNALAAEPCLPLSYQNLDRVDCKVINQPLHAADRLALAQDARSIILPSAARLPALSPVAQEEEAAQMPARTNPAAAQVASTQPAAGTPKTDTQANANPQSATAAPAISVSYRTQQIPSADDVAIARLNQQEATTTYLGAYNIETQQVQVSVRYVSYNVVDARDPSVSVARVISTDRVVAVAVREEQPSSPAGNGRNQNPAGPAQESPKADTPQNDTPRAESPKTDTQPGNQDGGNHPDGKPESPETRPS